jgi:hypothetical protein
VVWQKKRPDCSNAFGEVIEYAILIVRLLGFKFIIGVAMLLKIWMARLKDHVKIKIKTFPNPGEAINFQKKIIVRLHDQYKSECGPWIDVFIYGVQLNIFPN